MCKNMDTSILVHKEKIKSAMTQTALKMAKLASKDF